MHRFTASVGVSLVLIFSSFGGANLAQAVVTVPTPSTEFAESAPLLITAYQTRLAGTEVAAVEVYNDADEPVDLSDWALWAVTKVSEKIELRVDSVFDGLLLPGEHAVFAQEPNATFQIIEQTANANLLASLEMTYLGVEHNFKSVTATIKDSSDAAYFRTYTSTGYSTASAPFATVPVRPFYDDGLYVPLIAAPEGLKIVEVYPYSSDCAPNDQSVLCGDYVKLWNNSDNIISLDGLVLRTDSNSKNRESSNTITLVGSLPADGYLSIWQTNQGSPLSLTNSGGYVWLEEEWSAQLFEDTMQGYGAAGVSKQGFSYALGADGLWQWSTTPSPDGENKLTPIVEMIVECPEGKYRSPETGRCRTIEEAVNALSTCDEGCERNPVTNRCRKLALATSSLTPCLEGQERNPATNRCRSIAKAIAELLPCDEGYERNPATNRCRKVAGVSTPPAAAFPVIKEGASSINNAGWIAFGVVTLLALGYAVWEWRYELSSWAKRLATTARRQK